MLFASLVPSNVLTARMSICARGSTLFRIQRPRGRLRKITQGLVPLFLFPLHAACGRDEQQRTEPVSVPVYISRSWLYMLLTRAALVQYMGALAIDKKRSLEPRCGLLWSRSWATLLPPAAPNVSLLARTFLVESISENKTIYCSTIVSMIRPWNSRHVVKQYRFLGFKISASAV